MHSTILAATLLVAGITALPRCNHQILSRQLEATNGQVSNFLLESMITNLLYSYINEYPDPYQPIEQQIISYTTPDGSASVYCVVDGLSISGISDIVINRIQVSILRSTIIFNVTAPKIQASAASATCDIKFAGYKFTTVGSGTITVYNADINGSASASLFPSIRINSVNADVNIGGITADSEGTINGFDSTEDLDVFLNEFLLHIFNTESAAVNSIASAILLEFLSEVFN